MSNLLRLSFPGRVINEILYLCMDENLGAGQTQTALFQTAAPVACSRARRSLGITETSSDPVLEGCIGGSRMPHIMAVIVIADQAVIVSMSAGSCRAVC